MEIRDGRKIFSVVLLKESFVEELKNDDNTKIFEESVVLVNLEEDFFEGKSQVELVAYFNEYILPMKYENIYGENVLNKIVQVVDYFELMYEIEIRDFMEVYSRYFVEELGTTRDDMLSKYYA